MPFQQVHDGKVQRSVRALKSAMAISSSFQCCAWQVHAGSSRGMTLNLPAVLPCLQVRKCMVWSALLPAVLPRPHQQSRVAFWMPLSAYCSACCAV